MKKFYFLFIGVIFLMSCLSSPQKGMVKGDEGSSSTSTVTSLDQNWQTIDSFENVNDWLTANGEGTTIETKSVPGKKGKAVEIDYNLGETKEWVGINNFYSQELSKNGSFRIWIKGTGARNGIEFKLVDIDGSNFIKVFPAMTTRADWTTIVIPFKALIYGWGGDQKLDSLQQIWISVVMQQGGQGGKGTLVVDELEYNPGQ